MEITGKLIQKLGESSGTSEKTGMPWRSAEFLVEIPGNYTRKINFKVRDGQYNLIKRFEELVGKEVAIIVCFAGGPKEVMVKAGKQNIIKQL